MSRKNPICTEKTLYVQKKICTVQSFSKDGFLAKPEAHGAYSTCSYKKKRAPIVKPSNHILLIRKTMHIHCLT